MVDASNKINTFIRIDFVTPREKSSDQPDKKSGKEFGKKGQVKDEAVSGKTKNRDNEPLWDLTEDVKQKNDDVCSRVAAALYIYMIARWDEAVPKQRPLWEQRVSLMLKEQAKGNSKGEKAKEKNPTQKTRETKFEDGKGILQILLEEFLESKSN